jgi:hypothetical protein
MRNQELILLTHVSTESVNDGFLPAARRRPIRRPSSLATCSIRSR